MVGQDQALLRVPTRMLQWATPTPLVSELT